MMKFLGQTFSSLLSIFFILIFICCFGNELKRVDVVTYSEYLIPSDLVPYKYNRLQKHYSRLQEHFKVNFHNSIYNYVKSFSGDEENLKKILFYEYREYLDMSDLPKSKMICFKWEGIKIWPGHYDYYYRVYTIDDDLVDNSKFFKFYYPVLQPMLTSLPSFTEKNLCAMIVGHWFSERLPIVDFFAGKPADSLHLYGIPPQQYENHPMSKGRIPGFYSGPEKLNVLKQYKFSICFENTHTTPGYITEKIFDAFAAGCVPIYWGPNNVEKYIPAECFIDYRKFNNEELYDFITSMTESEYGQYLTCIQVYLESEEAQLFSMEHFEEALLQAALD